jgi:hypothetical protein
MFSVAALSLPLVSALLAPALWSWRPGWKAVSIGQGALLLVVGAWGLIAGSGAVLAATLGLSVAFALFALGLHLAAGQVVSGLVVLALNATLFLAPTAVGDALAHGGSEKAQARLDLLLQVNPWTSLAGREFKIDLLRDLESMYRTGVADNVAARPPAWPGLAAAYVTVGLILGAAAIATRRKRAT